MNMNDPGEHVLWCGWSHLLSSQSFEGLDRRHPPFTSLVFLLALALGGFLLPETLFCCLSFRTSSPDCPSSDAHFGILLKSLDSTTLNLLLSIPFPWGSLFAL